MKKIRMIAAALAALALVTLVGCRRNVPASPEELFKQNTPQPAATAVPRSTEDNSDDYTAEKKEKIGRSLVIYFSATGCTENVAQAIARLMSADIYRISPAYPYSEADLDYNDPSSRAVLEQADPECRPNIIGSLPVTEGYDYIFIGYPIWCGEAPKIVYTLVESIELGEATVIPFCTSGSSEIGESADHLRSSALGGLWIQGKRLYGSITDKELVEWLASCVPANAIAGVN